MRHAETAARLELQPVETQFQRAGKWRSALLARSARSAVLLRAEGWTDGAITRAALARLRDALIVARHVEDIELAGLNPDVRRCSPAGWRF